SVAEYPVCRFCKRTHGYIWFAHHGFVVLIVDEKSRAASPFSGFDVAPAIPDHVTRRQPDLMGTRGFQQQTGGWLAAFAGVVIVMITGKHRSQRQLRT